MLLTLAALAVLALVLTVAPTVRDATEPGGDASPATRSDAAGGGAAGAADGTAGAGAPTLPPGAPPPPGSTPTSGIEAAPSAAATRVPGDAVSEAAATQAPVPAVDGPFPATSESVLGRLVASYPADVLPPAPGSTVRSSSVSTSTERVQVALVAARTGRRDDVLAFYLRTLRAQGFVEEPATPLAGQAVVAVRRAGSSVVVTVGPGEATYSVYATLLREDT
ncbi:hypothetical protein [Nocardioides zeae]